MNNQASEKIESMAKRVFSFYKDESPEESFAWGGVCVYEEEEAFFGYDYKDIEFDTWVKAVYEIYKSPELIREIVEKIENEVDEDEDEDEDHKDYYQVDIDLLESIFEPFNIPEPLRGLVEYQNRVDSGIIYFHMNLDGNEYVK